MKTHMPAGKFARTVYRIDRKINSIIGSVKKNGVRTFWWNKEINFGDLLGPSLLREFGFTPIHAQTYNAEVVTVGSVLHLLSENYTGYIVGSGIIEDNAFRFPHAKILAVRGELTRERIGAPKGTILGDPGLLSDRLIKKRSHKRYTLGLIPHFFDMQDECIQAVVKKYPQEVHLINVKRGPLEVIREIDQCEYILSSSLHGMVVADSLGIPNTWMILSEKVRGAGFKFFDYASAFGCHYEPLKLTGVESLSELVGGTHNVSENIEETKRGIEVAYRRLRDELLDATKI